METRGFEGSYIERLAEGIRRAHAAGNIDHVKTLGTAYRKAQSEAQNTVTLNINGRKVTVDPSFLSLSKDDQNRTVDEIWQSISGRDAASDHTAGPWTKYAKAGAPDPSNADAYAAASAASQTLQGKVSDLPSQRPTLADEAMSFGRGVIEGIPVIGPTLSDWRRGLDANIGALAQGRDADELKAQYEAQDRALADKTGGARLAGNVTGAVASLAPFGAVPGVGKLLGMSGGTGSRMLFGAGSAATISGADTLARGGSFDDAGRNALLGGALGGALPIVGAGIRRMVTPAPASQAKTAAADALRREGVELTAGQRTGSEAMRMRESELGGTAARDFMDRQADQFTAAALRRAGVDATRATPEVIDEAFARIGGEFEVLQSRNAMMLDGKLADEIVDVVKRYRSLTSQSQRVPIVDDIVQDLIALEKQGSPQSLAGPAYQRFRSKIEAAARSTKNSDVAEVLRDLKGALDDATERWMQLYNPQDLGAWREARRQYRNMLVLEDAATRAGQASAEGVITPQALRSAAIKQNKRAFARGKNEFADLANAGVSAMTPLPNSGTAGRLAAKLPLPLGAGTGAALGSQFGVTGAVVGGLLGAAAPWAVGRGMLSAPGRAYLGNQLLPGAGRGLLPPAVAALQTTRRD